LKEDAPCGELALEEAMDFL